MDGCMVHDGAIGRSRVRSYRSQPYVAFLKPVSRSPLSGGDRSFLAC